jgi:hypothetical protein
MRDLEARRRARDRGLLQLKALTGVLAVGMALLAGAVAALAAGTVAGRKLVRSVVHPSARAVVHRHRTTAIPPPPPLPPVGSNASPALSAPSQAPASAPSSAPVAVSGGS